MAYTILITKSAKKDIDVLDSLIRKRLGKKLCYFAKLDDLRSVAKQLEDSRIGEYRLRVGDYRILFDLHGSQIVILRVQHRKDVYQ
jgi:mRNA interferase RelE/StbE